MNLQEAINSFIDYKMDHIGFISVSADIQMYDVVSGIEKWYGAISGVNMDQERVTLGLLVRDWSQDRNSSPSQGRLRLLVFTVTGPSGL